VKQVVADILPAALLSEQTVYHINPTGSFEIGGPDGDGGPHRPQDHRRQPMAARRPHGGGRVQRQGSHQGRPLGRLYHPAILAKNIVAAGLARRCTIQLAYAIGVSKPLSLYVDTHGTGAEGITDAAIEQAITGIEELGRAHPRAVSASISVSTSRSTPRPLPMAISVARPRATSSPGNGPIWPTGSGWR